MRPLSASSGRRAASSGSRSSIDAVRRDDEHAAQHGTADEQALVLEVGHDDPRAVGRLDRRRAPRARSGSARLSSRQRRLSVTCRPGATANSASTWRSERAVCSASSSTRPWLFFVKVRKTPCGVRSAVQRRPVVRVDDAEVGQRLGRRVERARRRSARPPRAGRAAPGRRTAARRSARRSCARRSTAPTSGPCSDAADDEQDERRDREGDQPRRRAHAGAQILERASSCGASGAAARRRRRAGASGGSQTSGAVQKNIASPCQIGRTSHSSDQRDERQRDRDGPRPAMHRP